LTVRDLGGDADLSRVQGCFEGRSKSGVGDATLMPQKPIPPGGALGGVGTGRLDERRKALESVLEHEDTVGILILVFANKQDREGCMEVMRIKEGFLRRVFKGLGGIVRDSRLLPVIVLKGTGVRQAVELVRSRVVWNKESR
jgi:ADP-ribosylation factor related protein 1